MATGADNIFAVRFHRQTELVAASTLVAGDYIAYLERIWPVFTATPAGTGKVTFKLGHGAFYEPELTLNDDDQVPLQPAGGVGGDRHAGRPPRHRRHPATVDAGGADLDRR